MLKSYLKSLFALLPNNSKAKLRSWKIQRSIASFKPFVAKHQYGDVPLEVWIGDAMGQGWYNQDWPLLPEIKSLRVSKLRPGARVFDLGAHQCVVAMMLANEVGELGQVIALEPNEHNNNVARKNFELNRIQNITLIRGAVSDRLGTIAFDRRLNGQLDDGSGEWGKDIVDTFTVDALSEKYGVPDVVFIDVEGAEFMALTGASKILKSRRTDFFVEVHVGCGLEKLGGNSSKVLSFFSQDKYDLSIRSEEDSTFRPLKLDDSALEDRFFLLAIPRNQGGSDK